MTALDPVLRNAASVRVDEYGEQLLLVDDPAALGDLRRALAVQAGPGIICMCLGDIVLSFFDTSGRRLVRVAYHRPDSISWSGSEGTMTLTDSDALLHWMAGQGADGPLTRDERQRQAAVTQEAWRAAAPVALPASGTITAADLNEALVKALPDPIGRAAAVLQWHGSGTGRCTGFPFHEALPEPVLAAMPISHLIRALQQSPDKTRMHDGAVRHLCGWKTREHQASDITHLPDDVRQRLLRTARESGDDDKRQRAEHWLTAPAKRRRPTHRSVRPAE
ncbi:hypothetical protein [Actinoplanes sp. NPDC051494]|uniref:hypothetical protein n=1 Tax=Actinoplanes sp. NPDC051494 TaxID=3363907 RepID=UPI0037A94122